MAIAMLLALEGGLRLLTGRSSRWNVRLGAHKVYDPVVFMRNKPNYTFANGTTTNEYGYWAPTGLRYEKPEGILRIIYLGDSNTVFPLGDNYPVQVERILEAETGLEVETINASVPGYSSENAWLLMEHELSRFEADYFFVYLGWNDLGQFGPEALPYKRVRAGYRLSTFQHAISNLYSLRFAYAFANLIRHRQPAVNASLDAQSLQLYEGYWPDHFVENLTRIIEVAKERYPHVYLMTLATLTNDDPSPDELRRAHFPVGMEKNMVRLHSVVNTYNRAVEQVASATSTPIIDLFSGFDSREARSSFTDSCHVDKEGAKRIADHVADEILREERSEPRFGSLWQERADVGEPTRAPLGGGEKSPVSR